MLAALFCLPEQRVKKTASPQAGFIELLARPELLRMFAVAFGAFFVFSSTFNYLPFYLSRPPFSASTEVVTFMYLAYLVGIVMGPASGRLSNRFGSGATMTLGSLLAAAAIATTMILSLALVAAGLIFLCAGFFSIHAAAVGLLSRRVPSSRGRANSLYVLCYYLGGAGITACGYAYARHGWSGTAGLNMLLLLLPLTIGLLEIARERRG